MKAARIHASLDIRVEEVEDPHLQEDEVLVKVKACGICGTDIHTYKSEDVSMFEKPLIIGHEFSGEIVEVGSSVEGLMVGDRVVGTGYRHCGVCYWCQQSQIENCINPAIPGYGLDGAFAEYVVVPRPALGKTFLHIPDTLSWQEAATIEPVSVACVAVKRARITANDNVVILGAGMIGQTVAQVCRAMGAARVTVSEPSFKRLQIMTTLGVDEILNPTQTDPVEVIRRATSGRMADVVFECSGTAVAFHQGLQMTRHFGRMMQVGMFENKLELSPSTIRLLVDKNITLRGSSGQAWANALELMQTDQVRTKDLITHEFPLNSIKKAFEAQLNPDEAIKVMVRP